MYEYTTGILTISEQSGNDKVLFKNGIMFGQVGSYLTKSGDDLILKINGSETDQVIVKNFFLGGGYEVENFSFETGGSITSSQIYQVFGISRPLNAEDKVEAIVSGDIGNHVLTSDASVSELFILNDGQDILKLLQSSTGKTALDYVSDFKVSEDKLDLSAFLDQNQVNSSNIDDYLAISYDANLKTNTLSVRTDPNSPAQELLVLMNQFEYLSVQDLLLNQSIVY